MDWTAGYASDIEYVAGFYKEQSPLHLNFVCAVNGYEPVPLDKPFTYFELGFGRGLTANILAAANPNGRFYATDFNPAHVVDALDLARESQLPNLVLLENSFAELAQGAIADLPQFDFITLHGIYSWVTAENRAHIVDFIARYLKPGGIVYVSYNAMPGWTSALPLQRLLVEHAERHPNRSDLQLDAAKVFIGRMVEAKAGYFEQNPNLAKRLDTLNTGSKLYLVHEFMHRHWQPMYHLDVAHDFSNAKLNYVGSAELALAYPILFLTPEKQAILDGIADSGMRETMKDYMLNTAFRKDVYVRGAREMKPARKEACLRSFGLALTVPRKDVTLKMKLVIGEVDAKPEMYLPVLDALAVRPHTLTELAGLPCFVNSTLEGMAQIASILIATGQAAPYLVDAGALQSSPTGALNQAVSRRALEDDEYQALASPLIASGLVASYIERLVYWYVQQGTRDAATILQNIAQMMASQGRRLKKSGQSIQSDQEHDEELRLSVQMALQHALPLWQQLKML